MAEKKISDDAIITAKITNSNGVVMNIKSSVLQMFEKHIRSAIESVVKEFEAENMVQNIEIEVDDYGALDFIIRARTRMAIRRALKEGVKSL